MHQFLEGLLGRLEVLSGDIAATRENAGSGHNAHARLDHDFPFGSEEHVHARAKLDEADALASGDCVSGFLVEDDAAGDEAGNLLNTTQVPSPRTLTTF